MERKFRLKVLLQGNADAAFDVGMTEEVHQAVGENSLLADLVDAMSGPSPWAVISFRAQARMPRGVLLKSAILFATESEIGPDGKAITERHSFIVNDDGVVARLDAS